ncbi:hypothetical protein LL033_26120 (plasmid) [Clostridium estertheticum]|uniref:PBECR4 domain-containing protein n=1 Tax=Clostridium estertheticum TaxID=238834 RepID=UPI001C0B1770|nr:PBECR4 domain-containing protein [Clostridium estertheticum]MBU3218269.1 hypothetical protein [Clostridium estertheticum]WAG58229.1 hypothetical protein LL033_26120 [Clostridium estertheticum]
MEEISFKERVKNVAISEAKNYKKNYVDYEYLVCSSAFVTKDYYIVDAKEDNYQHLIGVHSLINPQLFFEKCFNETLKEEDFDFIKKKQTVKSVKGSVREKIKVLSNAMNLFNENIKVEETFLKNRVTCSFATADDKCTLGFINTSKSRPMSLLKGNELHVNKVKDISLLMRKKMGKEKFDEILIGDSKMIMTYYEKIKEHIDISITLSNQEMQEVKNMAKDIASTTEFPKEIKNVQASD